MAIAVSIGFSYELPLDEIDQRIETQGPEVQWGIEEGVHLAAHHAPDDVRESQDDDVCLAGVEL